MTRGSSAAVLLSFLILNYSLYLVTDFDFSSGVPPLDLRASPLDLGEVWANATHTHEVTLTNHGKGPVDIDQFVTACACETIDPPSLRIPAGSSRKITLTFDLTPKERFSAMQAERPFSQRLTAWVGPPYDRAIGWALTGTIKSVLQCDPPIIRMHVVKGQPIEPITCRVKSLVPLARLEAEWNPAFGRIEVRRLTAADDEFDVTAIPALDLPLGDFSAPAKLLPINHKVKGLGSFPLDVLGKVTDEVFAIPMTLALSSTRVGESVSGTIVLRAVDDQLFTLERSETSSPSLTVESVQSPKQGRLVVALTATPAHMGNYAESVKIVVVTANGRTLAIETPVKLYAFESTTVPADENASGQTASRSEKR